MKKITILPCLAALFLICVAMPALGAEKPFDGEFKTDLGFTIRLTDDWKEVPANIVKMSNEQMSKIAGVPQTWKYAYQLKTNDRWLAYPYVLLDFREAKISESQLKKEFAQTDTMQKGLEEASEKLSSIMSGAVIHSRNYDTTTHTGISISEMNVEGVGKIIFFMAMKLTNKGLIHFCAYFPIADQERMIPFFKEAVDRIEISPDLAYQPGLLANIPILGAIDWGQVGHSGLVGGIIGGIGGAIAMLFRKKKQS